MTRQQKILVVGVTGAGQAGLPAALLERIGQADLLVGGQRQLGYFPAFAGEKHSIGAGVEAAAERLRRALAAGERAVVLASGDPLCYGIGSRLRRSFEPEELEIIPAPTAYQLAFAALGEPWQGAALLSAHHRPLDDVVRGVQTAEKAAIFTDNRHTPAVVARALLEARMPADMPCAVCENLGSPEQRIVRAALAQVAGEEFAPLNVLVVWPGGAQPAAVPVPPGLPDEAFSTTGGLLTSREVRLLSLAELALAPGEVLWDIGAGSGAVSIEAARMQPGATVYAVERRAEMCLHIRENTRRFPVPGLRLIEAAAPEACAALPDPHAVFIGGSGGQLQPIIKLAQERLQHGGRLVINLVTLENLQIARDCLPAARVVQVQVSVGVPILDMLRLQAQNPVFVLTWKDEG